jgi:uncharacterized Fe-S cluster-containing radical SAM superfamily enzyme
MREAIEKEIDGVRYRITPFDPFKGSRIFTKILKTVGKPLGTLMKSGKAKDEGEKSDIVVLALQEAASSLNPDEIESLIKESLDINLITVSVDSGEFKKLSTHGHFNNYSLMHVLKVVRHSWEVNFKDFLSGLGDLKG